MNEIMVRNTMIRATSCLPRQLRVILQRWITYIIACPHTGQQQVWRRTGEQFAFISTLLLLVALATGFWAVKTHHWIMLLPVWAVVVHFAQVQYWCFKHHHVHGNFRYKWFVYLCCVLFLEHSPETMNSNHIATHHTKSLMKREDMVGRRLTEFYGFEFGWEISRYWIHFAERLISLQLYMFAKRLWDNVTTYPVMFSVVWGCIFLLAGITNSWQELALVFGIPAGLLWQIAIVISEVNEHHVPEDESLTSEYSPKEYKMMISKMTSDIFFGRAFPKKKGWLAGFKWWIDLVFWYFPLRFILAPGDPMLHRFHHLYPNADWPNQIWERYRLCRGTGGVFGPVHSTHLGFLYLAGRSEF